MKSSSRPLKPNSVARINISALLPTSAKMTDSIRRNLSGARRSVEHLRHSLEKLSDTLKELESQDKLGNFEIQNLMSAFNEAETLTASAAAFQGVLH